MAHKTSPEIKEPPMTTEYVVSSTLLRETPTAYWFHVTLSNGRVQVISIPKREENTEKERA
jgi:hypothetical protein